MMNHKFTIIATLFVVLPMVAYAGGDIVKKESKYGVKETMDRIEAIVKKKGMTVFARVDHKKNAQSAEMSMGDAEVLIFGNPRIGTRIMLHDAMAGLDLPLRILSYKDHDAKTWVVYHNPQGLKKDFKLQHCTVINDVENGLDKITSKAVK